MKHNLGDERCIIIANDLASRDRKNTVQRDAPVQELIAVNYKGKESPLVLPEPFKHDLVRRQVCPDGRENVDWEMFVCNSILEKGGQEW